MVNNKGGSSSESSSDSEGSRGLQKEDSCVGMFGDCVSVKNENTLRIGFQNAGGFPTKLGKLKEDAIHHGLVKWEFDIFGMIEMNLNWRMLPEQENLPITRTKEWWNQQHVSWTHNRTFEPRQPRQYGGAAIFSANKAAHRAVEKSYDESNLGRWVWTRYNGEKQSYPSSYLRLPTKPTSRPIHSIHPAKRLLSLH